MHHTARYLAAAALLLSLACGNDDESVSTDRNAIESPPAADATAGGAGSQAGGAPATAPTPTGGAPSQPSSGAGAPAPAAGTPAAPTAGAPAAPPAGGSDLAEVASDECVACTEASCAAEQAAVMADASARASAACSVVSGCSGECCVCGALCDPLGLNYGQGPCAPEVEASAGLMPGAGAAVNGLMLGPLCDPAMSPDTGCSLAVLLGDCVAVSCAAECGVASCQ